MASADVGSLPSAGHVDKIESMAITQPIKPAGTPPDDGASVVLERVPQKVKPPQMHQVVLLNDDVLPDNGQWLTELITQAARADVGVVGGLLRYPDGRLQHAGILLGINGVAEHIEHPRENPFADRRFERSARVLHRHASRLLFLPKTLFYRYL